MSVEIKLGLIKCCENSYCLHRKCECKTLDEYPVGLSFFGIAFSTSTKIISNTPHFSSLYLLWMFYKVHIRIYFCELKLNLFSLIFWISYDLIAQYGMAGKTNETSFFLSNTYLHWKRKCSATITNTDATFYYCFCCCCFSMLAHSLTLTSFLFEFPVLVFEGDFSCFSSSTIYNRFSSIFLYLFPSYLIHHRRQPTTTTAGIDNVIRNK